MVGILSAIGNTPLIQLSNLFDRTSINFFAKLETINPGGSIKDRTALTMVENAIKNGNINKNTTVIESTSGNLGIGLAQVCAYYKLKLMGASHLCKNIINKASHLGKHSVKKESEEHFQYSIVNLIV